MGLIGGSGFSIARSTGRCAACGRALAVGERFVAALVERDGEEQIERLDYAQESWDAGARPAPPWRLFASWRAVVAEPNASRRTLLDDDELVDLFEQVTGDDPKRAAFRYVLALILVRRRKLVYEGTREGVMRVRPKKPTPDAPEPALLEVKDPQLSGEVIEAVLQQLSEIMAVDAEPARGAGAGR